MTVLQPTGWQTLIIVLPSILAFFTASLAAILAAQTRNASAQNATKIENLHLSVNSRLDALIEATRLAARAEGLAAGAAAEKSAQADRDSTKPPP